MTQAEEKSETILWRQARSLVGVIGTKDISSDSVLDSISKYTGPTKQPADLSMTRAQTVKVSVF